MNKTKLKLIATIAAALFLLPLTGCDSFLMFNDDDGDSKDSGGGVVLDQRLTLVSNYEFGVGLKTDGTMWA